MRVMLLAVMIAAAMPAHAFKRAGEVSVVPAQVYPAVPAQVAPAADPAPVPVAVPVVATPTASQSTPVAPVIVKKAPPVKPAAPAKPVAAKSAVNVRERTGSGGQKSISGEVDVGQAIKNALGGSPAKGDGKSSSEKKPGNKTVAAKVPPENKEEGVADKMTQKIGSWWDQVKAQNAKCTANPESCSWGENNP